MKSGATGRWYITPHALDRYAEFLRISEPWTERNQGLLRRTLSDEMDRARFLHALHTGPQLWRGPRPRRLRFVVTVCSEGDAPALITVLGSHDAHTTAAREWGRRQFLGRLGSHVMTQAEAAFVDRVSTLTDRSDPGAG